MWPSLLGNGEALKRLQKSNNHKAGFVVRELLQRQRVSSTVAILDGSTDLA